MSANKRKRRHWTDADRAMFELEYPLRPTCDVAKDLGVSVRACYSMAASLGLRKDSSYLESDHACRLRRGDNPGVMYRFPKGHVPANKGLRRPGWSAGRMRQTQFKKGNKPGNWLPLLSERVMDGYLQVKVTDTGYPPRDWRPLHVLLWEEERGPVPPKHAVSFKDGDRSNFDIKNLDLVSRAELMRRNTIHNRLSPELRSMVTSLGQLRRRIRERLEQIVEANTPEPGAHA